MYQIYFILFWNDTLHVSDVLSVHHLEFQIVHTARGICQTDTALCLVAGTLASRQQYLFDICLLLYVQYWTPDYGRKDRPKHVECHSKIKLKLNKFDTLVHLVGFTVDIILQCTALWTSNPFILSYNLRFALQIARPKFHKRFSSVPHKIHFEE